MIPWHERSPKDEESTLESFFAKVSTSALVLATSRPGVHAIVSTV